MAVHGGSASSKTSPTVSYDTPDFMVSGASYFDEVSGIEESNRSLQLETNWKAGTLLFPITTIGFSP